MADCIISYIKKDEIFAQYLLDILNSRNLSVILSSISFKPDEFISTNAFKNLEQKEWILFLASKEACKSPYVLQEVGLVLGKKLVPVIWDISPDELPVWINRYYAIDLRNKSPMEISDIFSGVVKKIKADKLKEYFSV